ncbi:MAG: PqqD family protein [Thermodesulfobacteriota bacterium]|nr:PqqD family protein [Thermodesulfobacteriota bacterium]
MTKEILTKKLDSDLMLYDPDRDEVHILNATGGLIYELYKDGKGPHKIEQELRKRFQLENERDILKDVEQFLADLENRGLGG